MFCVFLFPKYVDDLIQEVVELCTKSRAGVIPSRIKNFLYFSATPTLCDCFHDATVRALTPVDVALQIRPINPSKPRIQYSRFLVHYTMLLPDNLLDTTMTGF